LLEELAHLALQGVHTRLKQTVLFFYRLQSRGWDCVALRVKCLFAANEVLPGLVTNRVVLDEAEVFGHVDGERVVGLWSTSCTFSKNLEIVFAFLKSTEFFNPIFDPHRELTLHLQERVQCPSVNLRLLIRCDNREVSPTYDSKVFCTETE
jgi:hypothetical protein